jgi:hypothetical protein
LPLQFPQKTDAPVAGYDPDLNFRPVRIRVSTVTIAASHQANYATIHNYLETELRYMDARG